MVMMTARAPLRRAAMAVPDHSTIAEFRCRHEQPLGDVFSGVLGLCARAGLVLVGVVAIDFLLQELERKQSKRKGN
jgi:transposase